MKMTMPILISTLLNFGASGCKDSLKPKVKTFESTKHGYSIEYPVTWTSKLEDDKILILRSGDEKCSVYVSVNLGAYFEDEQIPRIFVKSLGLRSDLEKNVLYSEKEGLKTWLLSFTDDENKFSRLYMCQRRREKIWLVSAECEPTAWQNGGKQKSVEILHSFMILGR